MKTLKVMTRVVVEGWVEVEREVSDNFDAAQVDVSGSWEDDLVERMAATATHRLAALVTDAKSRALETRYEVTP
jgi:hypothetical protein